MGHCKDCRWWGEPEGVRIWIEATKEDVTRMMGTCELTRKHGESPDHPESLAFGWDAESYSAHLDTSPEFGCVQWEAKP